jgi:broad specificity phosphatase PhoE
MAMPNELVLVRHGHSEGNLVVDYSKQGDDSFYTPDFRERPGHQWRLTQEGQKQAQISGQWILENIGQIFDRYYVSPYIRTKETAGLLNLPKAEWRVDQRLRERDWGDICSMPRAEFKETYPNSFFMKELDALYWRPPGGESIADVRLRVRNFFDTLHRECAGQRVIVVTHGEFIWAARAEIEYMTDEGWVLSDKDPLQKIYNTQVLQYSRTDPKIGTTGKYIGWKRSICPWKENNSVQWSMIERNRFTNEELLEQVRTVNPLSSSEKNS